MGCLTACLIASTSLGLHAADPPAATPDGATAAAALPLNYNTDQLRDMAIRRLAAQGMLESDPPSSMWSAMVQQTASLIEAGMQVGQLQSELRVLRSEVAELRTFIADHERLGDDYQSYQAILNETKRLITHQIRLETKRKTDELRKTKKSRAQQRKAQQAAVLDPYAHLVALGFNHLGNGVMLGKSGYQYAKRDVTSERVTYVPTNGGGTRRVVKSETRQQSDYSVMTISGSLLNATDTIRNVGVAFAFRDSHGNQIGQETVMVENMRPNVPYPFTSELSMASDRPFATETQWVLYSDPTVPAATPVSPAPTP